MKKALLSGLAAGLIIFIGIGSVAADSMRTESIESPSFNHTSAASQNIDGLSGIYTPVIAEQDKTGDTIFTTSWNPPMGYDDPTAVASAASAGHIIHGRFFDAFDFTLIRQPATIFLFGVGLTVAASMRLRKTK